MEKTKSALDSKERTTSAVAELDYSPISCLDPRTIFVRGRYQKVRCGKCYMCQKKRSHDWVNRIDEHIKHNKKTYWITLTYREEDVPIEYLDVSDSVLKTDIQPVKVLNHKHVQLFLKRIRKELPKLSYYMVGEYGPETLRPHYHMLIFLEDYVDGLMMSQILEKHWVFGFFKCKQPEWQQIHYAVKYIQFTADLPNYLRYSDYKPYMVCSKGIGKGFISNNVKEYYTKLVNSLDIRDFKRCTEYVKEGFKFGLPKYYKDRIFTTAQKQKISYVLQNQRDDLPTKAEKLIANEYEILNSKIKNGLANEDDYESYNTFCFQVNKKRIDRIRNIREQEKRFIAKSRKNRVI